MSAADFDACMCRNYWVLSWKLVRDRINLICSSYTLFASWRTHNATESSINVDEELHCSYTTNPKTCLHTTILARMQLAMFITTSVKSSTQHAVFGVSTPAATCDCDTEYNMVRMCICRTTKHYCVSFLPYYIILCSKCSWVARRDVSPQGK